MLDNNINALFDCLDQNLVSNVYVTTPENCKLFLDPPGKQLKILTFNIRSINCNFTDLQTLLHRITINFDFLILTECWLSCASNDNIPLLDNYTFTKTSNHLNKNDGVVVYARSDIQHSTEEINFNGSASGTLIKIRDTTAIVSIYRSPSTHDIEPFLASLDQLLPSLSKFKSVILTGDINININPTDLNTLSHNYLNRLAFHGYLPTHDLPTRENSCLDHTIIRSPFPSQTLVIDTPITDHAAVVLLLNTKIKYDDRSTTITKIDYEKLDKDINDLDFSSIHGMTDPEIATDTLINMIKTKIDANTTVRTVPKKHKILKPWITPGLLKCIKNRDKLHKNSKLNPNNEILKTTFQRYRNFCIKILKKVKRQFNKLLWDAIKRLTNTTKPTSSPTQLLSPSTHPTHSCNRVNEFFVNIADKLAKNIEQTGADKVLPPSQTPSSTLSSFVLLHTDPDEHTQMAFYKIALLITVAATIVEGQRPFYAGSRPIGYPEIVQNEDLLSNRFGVDEPVPLEARGDRNLVYRLKQLPEDNQPFWYLNWRQYDEARRQPQSWPQRPSFFNQNNGRK
ncbi:uncharacterized protein LOC119693433 [Plutella xylostella]|uniref:uncharacterized protein LOC119693433 n=1 Tax=Plutella xylostella TaxID=51655 RepID=UPI0020331BE8|nr:uncharacterized protein LOC119693433 [Plutella xylostella]